ncbi:MAG: AAA family ATPase [Candidatus Dormiibacterota bacterium]
MKVVSVKLQGFGALSGRFKLDPQLTIVGGPNESGKSTLHTALRLALCGLDLPNRGRMPKDTEEVLRRFRPWQGGGFKVEAEIELNGHAYRFVRDLDQPDNSHVFDLVKGGEVTDQFRRGRQVDISVGLGMSREAFLAVSTVAQDQLLSLTGAALQEDLQRAAATSGSDGTARSAIDLLQHWRQENIRGDRTTTKRLDRLPKDLEAAEIKLEKAIELRRQLAQDLGSKDSLQAELTEVEATAAAKVLEWKTAELAEIQADVAAVAEIDTELQATPELRLPKNQAALRDAATGARGLAGQWQEAEARVAGLAPLDKDLERLSQQSAPSELAFLVGALEQPLPPLPPRSDLPGRLDLLDRRKVALYRWTSDLLAVVGGAAGVFLVAFGATRSGGASIPVVIGGLVLLVLVGLGFFALQSRLRLALAVGGFTSMRQMRRAANAVDPEMVRVQTTRRRVEAERAQANKRLAELGIAQVEVERLKQLADQLPAAQEALQERATWSTTAQRFRDELIARAKRVGISGNDPGQLAAELGSRLRNLDEAEDSRRRRAELEARRAQRLAGRELRSLSRRAEELTRELSALGGGEEPLAAGVASEELRQAYDQARARRDEVRDRLLPLQGRLEEQLKESGDVAGLEEEVADLRQDVARLTRAEEAVKLAIGELELAEGVIHNDLAPVLAQGLGDWLPAITNQRYRQVWVNPSDLSMHVCAQDSDEQIQVEDLSQGTREQIYVALRTVLAKALSPKGEAVPLFFDDPFVSADDARCMALLDTFRELSKSTQVVLFSHESRVGSWATRSEVPILTMKLVPASAHSGGDPVVESDPAQL